ncbi:MAG: hypothetical protein K6E97_09785, partial [Treponema sp.]|nr:hypothetical protein [Treponema sp.]
LFIIFFLTKLDDFVFCDEINYTGANLSEITLPVSLTTIKSYAIYDTKSLIIFDKIVKVVR